MTFGSISVRLRALQNKPVPPRIFFGGIAAAWWALLAGVAIALQLWPHAAHTGVLLHISLFAVAFTIVAMRSPKAIDMCPHCKKAHRRDIDFCSECGLTLPLGKPASGPRANL